MSSSFCMDIPEEIDFINFDKNNIYLLLNSSLLCAYSKYDYSLLWQHNFFRKKYMV